MKIPKNCQGCNKNLVYPYVSITIDTNIERNIVIYCDVCEYALCTNDQNRIRPRYNRFMCVNCYNYDINSLWPVKLHLESLCLYCEYCLKRSIKGNYCVVECNLCHKLKPTNYMHCYLVANGHWICKKCNKANDGCCIKNDSIKTFGSYIDIYQQCFVCNKNGCSVCMIDRKYHYSCIEQVITLFKCLVVKANYVPKEIKKIILDETGVPWEVLKIQLNKDN